MTNTARIQYFVVVSDINSFARSIYKAYTYNKTKKVLLMNMRLRIHALGKWALEFLLWNACCKRLMISKIICTSNRNLWTLYLKRTVWDRHKHRPSENAQLFYRFVTERGLPTVSLWTLCSAVRFQVMVSTFQMPCAVRELVKRHRTCSSTRANVTSIYTQHCVLTLLGPGSHTSDPTVFWCWGGGHVEKP
jgi:hypothetical protein